MSENLRISTFGGMLIQLCGKPVKDLASRKAEALLVYLASTGRQHSREHLATLLWDDRTSSRALGNLSVLLTSLRKNLPEYLTITRHWISINQERDIWIDTQELESCLFKLMGGKDSKDDLSEEDVARLGFAANLYKGDFLEGFFIRDSSGFDEWVIFEREHYKRQLVEAFNVLAGYYLQKGNYEKGIENAQRGLELDPLLEELHRKLMMLLARNGQVNAALNHYKENKRVMLEELGVEPSAKTRKLHMRIMSAESGPQYTIPYRAAPLIGREEEMLLIRERLDNPDCRLLTIVGPGGIGKTHLAIHAVRESIDHFLNGVCHISFTAISTSDSMVYTLADALRYTFSKGSSTEQQLIDYLREKEILLVLDNFEQLLPYAGLLSEILQQSSDVKMLVTSRERLNLQEEWILDLGGLEFPLDKSSEWIECQDTEALEKYSAMQLFLFHARKKQSNYCLANSEKHGLSKICQLLEGMPLAIELSSSWVPVLSCSEIAKEIGASLDFLESNAADISARHRNIRAVFDHSWNLLSQAEQRVFRQLSVFAGGFTRNAAEMVAGATLVILSTLVQISLVRRAGLNRFELHELIRMYAHDKLCQHQTESEEVRESHCEYFADLLHSYESSIFSSDQHQTLEEITEEYKNILAAVIWAAEHRKVIELNKSNLTLWYFCEARTRFEDALQIGGRSASALRSVESENRDNPEFYRAYAWSFLFLGYGYIWQGQFKMAQKRLEEGLAVAEAGGDEFMTAMMLNYIGLNKVFQRDDSARQNLERGNAITDDLELVWLKRFLVHNLGLEACNRSDFGLAQKYFNEQLDLCNDSASPRTLAGSYKGLADVSFALENFDESWDYYEKAAADSKSIDDNRFYADNLSRMGDIAYINEDYELAKENYLESLLIERNLGIRLLIPGTLNHLGYVSNKLEEYEESYEYFQEALKLALEIDVPYLALEAFPGFALHFARQGETTTAVEILTFVIYHDDCDPNTRERANQIIYELLGDFAEKEIAAAKPQVKSKKLEEVARGLLIPKLIRSE